MRWLLGLLKLEKRLNIRYYKSQPWGSANDILLGFFCDVKGNDEISMDTNELKYADWVQRDEIILQPGEFSLTNEMMKLFKENKVEWKYHTHSSKNDEDMVQ